MRIFAHNVLCVCVCVCVRRTGSHHSGVEGGALWKTMCLREAGHRGTTMMYLKNNVFFEH